MFSGILTKGKAATVKAFGTDSQKIVVDMLFEDGVQVISSFDMNKVASLTYVEDIMEEIFEVFR